MKELTDRIFGSYLYKILYTKRGCTTIKFLPALSVEDLRKMELNDLFIEPS